MPGHTLTGGRSRTPEPPGSQLGSSSPVHTALRGLWENTQPQSRTFNFVPELARQGILVLACFPVMKGLITQRISEKESPLVDAGSISVRFKGISLVPLWKETNSGCNQESRSLWHLSSTRCSETGFLPKVTPGMPISTNEV